MADQLQLEVVTPQQQLLAVKTGWVTIPGSAGELGILPQHVPLLTTIDSGVLRYEASGKEQRIAIHYGYAQVSADRVTILAEMAEPRENIDQARAQKAHQLAQEKLQQIAAEAPDAPSFGKYQAKLKRASVRLTTHA